MTITDVQVKKVFNNPESPVKANVSVVLDGEFIIHNVRIIEKEVNGEHKKFVSFPANKTTVLDENNQPRTGFIDICHPISSACRVKFEKAIYDAVANAPKEVAETEETK